MVGLDPILSLAHTLHSTPRSHAFLLGAGVSIASGAPSAWGVVTELIGQLADQRNIPRPNGDAVEQWYQDTFNQPLSYEGLLEQLAPTQTERQQLLRQFFEPPIDDSNAPPGPSTAHRALARLVATGAVRVIVTLNFDRLMERALIDEGIEPVVASTPSQIATLVPLHTIKALVIHLHGDYLEPLSMKNTVTELSGYDPAVVKFLDRLLDDYGLVAIGWSAAYDPALREAILGNSTRVFTGYFINPGPLAVEATDLIAHRNMILERSPADLALGRLADSVAALNQRQARHPLLLLVAVETAKRQLAGNLTAVPLHDSIKSEIGDLRALSFLETIGLPLTSSVTTARAVILEAAPVAAGLIAACAYWGNSITDRWWIGELASLSNRRRGGGLTDLLDLPKLAGTVLYHAAGVAAIAARRYDLARHLLMHLTTIDEENRPDQVRSRLSPHRATAGSPTPSFLIFQVLLPIFVDHLALGTRGYEAAWEEFEFLRLVVDTLALGNVVPLAEAIDTALARVSPNPEARQYLLDDAPNAADVIAAEQARATETAQNVDRARGALGRAVPLGRPHLRCAEIFTDGQHGWQALIATRLLYSGDPAGWRSIFTGAADWITDLLLNHVLTAVSWKAGQEADRRSWSDIDGTSGALKTYLWVDTGEGPSY